MYACEGITSNNVSFNSFKLTNARCSKLES